MDNGCSSGRQSARNVLRGQIKRVEAELEALQALHYVIEWDFINKEDEEKLWLYFTDQSRRT